MSAWAEVDALRAQAKQAPARASGRRVVFAEMRWERDGRGRVDDKRFAADPAAPHRIFVLRHCYYVPGKWRALDRRTVASLQSEAARFESLWWGVRVRELMVAFDLWLDGGCRAKKMKRLMPFVRLPPEVNP